MHDNADSVKLARYTVCAVIFYRQTPARLRKLVASLDSRCDALVALDGPYAGLSDVLSSPMDNYNALQEACEDIGIPCWLYSGQVYRGEPEKRTAAARAALSLAKVEAPESEPWVLMLDSDEWLENDINWMAVAGYGYGSGIMQSYRDGEQTPDGGTGSKMVRLFPNTPDLVWGPAHFDVRDMGTMKTYTGWERALVNECQPAFVIGHDLGEKVIQAEYEEYNDVLRVRSEGKMMRIVDDYQRGGENVVIRMDNEQIRTNKWRPGNVISIGGPLLGQEEQGYVTVEEIRPVAGHEDLISDIVCTQVDTDEAERLSQIMFEAELEQRQLQTALLQRRAAKRARQRARQLRRYNA